MHRSRPKLLLTGFGPFPGAPRNASSLLVDAIADAAASRLRGFEIHAATLPTEWLAGPAMVRRLLDELKPAVAIHFGVSHRARGFVIETRASNALQNVKDACGASPAAACMMPDGPDEMAVTLPTRLMAERLRALGLPVELSRDAGGYLCNAVLYTSLGHARAAGRSTFARRRGFVHIPDRLTPSTLPDEAGQSRRSRITRLSWHEAVEGGLEMLAIATSAAAR